jgi:predicted GH43/DUF377 family glycosyl hydrolase
MRNYNNIDQNPMRNWQMGPFKRPSGINPIISPINESFFECPIQKQKINWETLHTFNPAAVVKDNKVFLLYRAEDDTGKKRLGGHTSRLGLAESYDGLHFKRMSRPVFYPADDSQKKFEWEGGCEDPRLIEAEDGTYFLTYTQWNRRTARLAIASSKDLIDWEKYGSIFETANNEWKNKWTKAGAILCELKEGRLKATKINGKYWMYFGELKIWAANSLDLIHWKPEKLVLNPRKNCFDDALVEAGPPAILTKKGILLLYNAKNREDRSYSAGQALFDKKDPTNLITRSENSFFKPEESYELTGQYNAGTVFVEGLIYFKEKWFLYYGCADSHVAVAVCELNK